MVIVLQEAKKLDSRLDLRQNIPIASQKLDRSVRKFFTPDKDTYRQLGTQTHSR
jgi:hypothetical protein